MKKGFTLVELLAIITLLGLISVVIISTTSSQYRDAKKELSNAQKNMIYSAAETYVQKYKNEYPNTSGSTYCIYIQDLVNEGLVSDNLMDAVENAKIPFSHGVKITIDANLKYQFTFDSKKSICKR